SHRGGRQESGAQAVQPVPGARLTDQERVDLRRRAGNRRVHGASVWSISTYSARGVRRGKATSALLGGGRPAPILGGKRSAPFSIAGDQRFSRRCRARSASSRSRSAR